MPFDEMNEMDINTLNENLREAFFKILLISSGSWVIYTRV